MTEAQWLACADPQLMLVFVRDTASDRKFRLFALACCARIDQHITDPRSQAALRFAEQHVEAGVRGRRGRPAVVAGSRLACRAAEDFAQTASAAEDYAQALLEVNAAYAADGPLIPLGYHAALFSSGFASNTVGWASGCADRPGPLPPTYEAAQGAEKAAQTVLLQDVLGPLPFRAVAVAPAWLSWNKGRLRHLATAIFEERSFEGLPVLADALEEAGCTNVDMLNHCRGPGPHVRGCWVVDLLLGKG
jgi:hypothetical protein